MFTLFQLISLRDTILPYPVRPYKIFLRVLVKKRYMYWQLVASYLTVNSTDVFTVYVFVRMVTLQRDAFAKEIGTLMQTFYFNFYNVVNAS